MSLSYYESLEGMEGLAPASAEPASQSKSWRVLFASVRILYPGVLVALTIALAATWLSQHYGAPVMLFALLFGMSFHFLHEEGVCVRGIDFASRSVLRLGVALLGARITFDQIASLGLAPVLLIAAGVACTIAVGIVGARLLGLRVPLGVLSGGSVAICGASAALAIASVLPRSPAADRHTILTVVAVTAFSTVAMILYPIGAGMMGLSHQEAGLFLGGTIHDVAQVVGAGYTISPETGDTATFVKLFRVALLLPVVLSISLVISRRAGLGGRKALGLLPPFLIAFAILVAINSARLIPQWGMDALGEASRWLLATAVAALGMKTSFKMLGAVGWQPIALIAGETAFIALFVSAGIFLLR